MNRHFKKLNYFILKEACLSTQYYAVSSDVGCQVVSEHLIMASMQV